MLSSSRQVGIECKSARRLLFAASAQITTARATNGGCPATRAPFRRNSRTLWQRRRVLHRAPSLERPRQRGFVGILEVASDRKTAGNTGDADIKRLQELDRKSTRL